MMPILHASLLLLLWASAGLAQNAIDPNATAAPPVVTEVPSNVTGAPVEELTTVAPTPTPPACYNNLTVVAEALKAKNPFKTVEYILCPNTEYKLGFFDSSGNCCEEGFQLPVDARANSIFKCGEDGKSSNNCTLVGGQVQALISVGSYQGEPKDGVEFHGITFVAGVNAGVVVAAPGEFRFIDCVWKDQRNIGAVSLVYFVRGGRRLQEIDELEDRDLARALTFQYYADVLKDEKSLAEYREIGRAQRHLDDVEVARADVTLERCRFEDNTYGEKTQAANYGVLAAETHLTDLSMDNCVFIDNVFGDISFSGNSYAVRIEEGSTLKLTDTCLVNNNFIGRGPVLADLDGAIVHDGNYATFDADVECQFIAVGEEKVEKCGNANSDVCVADPSLTEPFSAMEVIVRLIAQVVALLSALMQIFGS